MVGVVAMVLAIFLQARANAGEGAATNGPVAVMFNGTELFELASVSSVSAEIRAESVVRQMKRVARSPLINTADILVQHEDTLKISVIMAGPNVVLAVLEPDAALHGTARQKLAEKWSGVIEEAIERYRRDRTTASYLRGIAFAAVATLIFAVSWMIVCRLFKREMKLVEARFAGQQMLKLLDGDTVVAVNGYIVRISRALILLAAFIVYLNAVLSFFPWTYNVSAWLFGMIKTPVVAFGHGLVDNLPNLFTLAVIFVIVRFLLRGLKHIFSQIGEGKVKIKGFYQDWSDTTYRLVRMVVVVFAAVVAFPYIPGSNSPAFKGISIFMGVLVSLGSTSAVGNIFGGLMLTYMRSFSPGDFVEINGMRGTVMASRTFATRLRTPTNEVISIPNSAVSANPIINYSRMTKSSGVNIGTSVTIGYDVPWRKVHELLLKSAEGVDFVLEDPAPIILQLELDDFYVKYKLVVSTKEPAKQFRILSNIHQNIQDNFADAGVEIMSPHYRANRAGDQPALPADDHAARRPAGNKNNKGDADE